MIRVLLIVLFFGFAILSSYLSLQNFKLNNLIQESNANLKNDITYLQNKLNNANQKLNYLYDSVHDLYAQIDNINDVVIFYRDTANIDISEREKECLAKNVYFEAGVEDHSGKIAVAQVTLNRLQSGRWGNNICNVVYARSQFSWTLLANKRNKTPGGPLWERSLLAVDDFLAGARIVGLENSLFYYADYISTPRWARTMNEVAHIGRHKFFEEG
jgi:spore germination cell wall hydrolase CwlJ-like protein